MPGIKPVVGMEGMGGARELAEMLRQLGRGRDTVLAHITPEEAQMLMDMGGAGTTNPATGLPEFQEDFVDYGEAYGNVTNAPVDYSYMAPESVSMETNYPVDMTGFRQPTGFEQATAPQPMPSGMRFDTNIPSATQRLDITSPVYRQPFPMVERQFLPEVPEQPGLLTRGAQAIESTAQQYRDLARQYPTVAKLLSTGITTLPTLINAVRARRESEQAAQRLRQLGAPLREQGEALRQQALAGQLSPQEAAAQEATRARLRQTAASRGATTGTQAAMIDTQLGRQRAQLSETKLNNAVKLLNLGNAYDEEAIRVALSGNQRVRNAVANIFANLGQQTASTAAPQQEQPVAQSEQRITRRPDTRQG